MKRFALGILCLLFAIDATALTYTVTNTNDSGAGSLRQAILDANGNAGADMIAFAIPGAGVHTIQPLTVLPAISGPTILDGYSQPGASANTLATGNNAVILIVLDGANTSGQDGLFLANTSTGSIIRGLAVGNYSTGIGVGSASTVTGCFVGTDASGATALPNQTGILVSSSAGVTIGGPAAAERNVVSGNTANGIWVLSNSNVTIVNNYVGTNAAGTAALTEQDLGVRLNDASNCIIGGQLTNGNLISGHIQAFIASGVSLFGSSSNNQILGNRIGTDATGTSAIPNGMGVYLEDFGGNSPSNNTIGNAGAPNLIAFNNSRGVAIAATATSAAGNSIRYNSIRQFMAIDLGNDGATPNDTIDTDVGPNTLQNTPVITSATFSAGTVTVNGTLHSTANGSFNVQVYTVADGNCGAEEFETETTVLTDAFGDGAFSVNFPGAAAGRVSAIATNVGNNTSEVSPCVIVGLAAPPQITIGDVTQIETNSGTTTFGFNVTLSGPYASTVSVDYATANGTATAPGDYASESGTITFSPGQTSSFVNVNVEGDTTFEPDETFVVNLTNASNGTIVDGQGVGTITNDDVAPVPVAPVPAAGTMALLVLAGALAVIALLRS
jgi:hypothetical protein